MNKRAFAILMILVLVTAGLFADYSVQVPGTVTATLKASIGEYLNHGFNINETKYQPTVTIDDAFGSTAPSFKYGFKTNAQGTFVFKMTVSDFINQTVTGTVKIKSVTSDKGVISRVGNVYTIFEEESLVVTSTERSDEAVITITPAKTGDTTDHLEATIGASENITTAPAGAYEASLTFSITAS